MEIRKAVELAKIAQVCLVLRAFENTVVQFGFEQLESYVLHVILADVYDF